MYKYCFWTYSGLTILYENKICSWSMAFRQLERFSGLTRKDCCNWDVVYVPKNNVKEVV